MFHQVVVEASSPLGMPHWADDEDFSLDNHVHHAELPEPADEAALQAFVEQKMQEPLDRSRPLWHFYLIDGYEGGSVVVSRFHHALADGMALAEVLLSLTDAHHDGDLAGPTGRALAIATARAPAHQPPRARRPARPTGHQAGLGRAARGRAPGRRPARGAAPVERRRGAQHRLADRPDRRQAAALAQPRRRSSVAPPGVAKRAVWSQPRPLVDIKLVGRTAGATVNDVLVGAVSAAISHYVSDRGGDPADLSTMVPVNVRTPGQPLPRELGNKFALVMLPLPTSRLAPLQRLAEAKRRMDSIKHSPEAVLTFGLITAIGLTNTAVAKHVIDFFAAKAIGVTTNVAGPRTARYLAGTRINGILGWVPGSGSADPGRVHLQLRRRRPGRLQGGCRAWSPTPRSSCTPSTTRWTPSSGSPPPSDREVTMPTDTASATVVVAAPLDMVLEHLRDVEDTPTWVSDIKEVEVLTRNDDGTPLTARSRHPPPWAPTATPSATSTPPTACRGTSSRAGCRPGRMPSTCSERSTPPAPRSPSA